MKLFSVYGPPAASDAYGSDDVVFVKDGFSWPALFVPLLWLLYHRMWIEFLIVLALVLLIEAGLTALGIGEPGMAWAGLAFNVVFAFEANDVRRARLARKGWRDLGPVMGRSLPEAEHAFFTEWLGRTGEGPVAPLPPRSVFPRPAPSASMRGGEDDVIGSLPLRS